MAADGGAKYVGKRRPLEPAKTYLNRILDSMRSDRSVYEQLWKDLADNFLPFRGRWLNEQPNQKIRRNLKIINETPVIAQRTFGAGMQAGLTSPSRPWFRLKTSDAALMEADGVREWLYVVETEMRAILSRSNFYQQMRPCYSEYGVFGTMALGVFDDDENGIHCCAYTIGSYFLGIDSKNRVNRFGQEFKWTVAQIVEKWVKDPQNKDSDDWKNISDQVKADWYNNQREKYVDLVYLVIPNGERQEGRLDWRGMAFVAYYYEAKRDDQKDVMLETKGYREFPIMVCRLTTNEGDTYGMGLGVDCLGSAKALQLQEKRKAQIIDKEVDPPMRAPSALRNQKTSQLAGDVTFVDINTGQAGFEPLSQWKPDRSGMLEDIASIESRVNTIMFADIFALFIQGEDNSDETATKTAAKQQEKLLMLGPVVEGQTFEFNNPFIDRLFNMSLRQGRFPQPPEALAGAPLKVEYVSVLAQAQNIIAVQGLNQFTGYVLGLAAQQVAANQAPTALDKLDVDQSIDEYSNLSGVVPTVVRTDSMVAQIRNTRAQQQAQAQAAQQAIEGAQGLAKAAKDASQAQLGNDSVLDATLQ